MRVESYLSKFKQNEACSNARASQLIRGLLQFKDDITGGNHTNTVSTFVFDFCDTIHFPKDSGLVNSMLTLCLELGDTHKCLSLWSDLKTMHLLRDDQLPYSLLFKCLVQCNATDKVIETLTWIESRKYILSVHDSFVTKLLSNCSTLHQLQSIHSFMERKIIPNSSKYTRTELILSFSRLNDIESALTIFRSIDHRKMDIVSIGAMMTALIDHNRNEDALTLYDEIPSFNDHIHCDEICDNLAIVACGNQRDLERGKQIASRITFHDGNIQIQNSLISFFGECGHIESALDIYNAMNPNYRDSVTVGALMTAMVNNEADKDALKLYDSLSFELKSGVIYALALKASTKLGDFQNGKQIHQNIIDHKFRSSYTNTALIDFYGNFGDIDTAKTLYDALSDGERDITAINAMLTVYLNNNRYQDLIQLYDTIESMPGDVQRNGITHNIALKACANLCDLEKGQSIHKELISESNTSAGSSVDIEVKNTLIGFYGNCSNITRAWNIFDCISENERNVTTNNAMMTAYSANDFHEECVKLYHETRATERDVISHNIAIQSCTKTKNVDEALRIFESVPDDTKDVVTVNMMMQCYVHNERSADAVMLYQSLGHCESGIGHIAPNQMSLSLAIKAYTKLDDYHSGKMVIDSIESVADNDSDETDDNEISIELKNRMIDFFGHFGEMDTAMKIFESITETQRNEINVVTLNVMLNALCRNKRNKECLELFRRMESEYGVKPDMTSYQNALASCAEDTSLDSGRQIGEEMKRMFPDSELSQSVTIQMNLIQMYGKCGYLEQCEVLFEEMKRKQPAMYHREICIWNAMLHAFGRNGYLHRVKALYAQLLEERELAPDRQTFIDVLNAYGHCHDSDIGEAQRLWNEIGNLFVKFDCIVVTTLVDCLSRRGCLNDAYDVIMQFENETEDTYYAMWLAVLSGCRKFENRLLGQKIYDEMEQRFDAKDHCMTHANVLLSHLNLPSVIE